MKRPLLIGMMGLAALYASAQTTVETALDLKTGENSYTQDEASYAQVYFKYTAPEGESQLLYISTDVNSGGGSFAASTTGSTQSQGDIVPICSTASGDKVIPVKAGQTIYIIASIYSKEFKFNVSAKAANVDGATVATAVEGTEESFYIPYHTEEVYHEDYHYYEYVPQPTYVKYVAKGDDVLQLTFENYVKSVAIQEGEDGTPQDVTVSGSYDSSTYKYTYSAKMNVEKGKTYYLLVTPQGGPMFASLSEVVISKGSTYELPFDAQEGANVLPAATGKYWYKYTAQKSGFLNLTSEAGLPSGTVSVYNNVQYIPYNNTQAQVSGSLGIRFEVEAGKDYYICVEKAIATDADETFSLTLEQAQDGDKFSQPIVISELSGTETLPESDGVRYYSITVPKGEYIFTVKAEDGPTETSGTLCTLFTKDSGGQYSLTSGYNGFRYQMNNYAETTYIFSWNCKNNENGFKFSYSCKAVEAGDVATNPLTAVEGDNELKAASEKYYTFTPSKGGWLTIDTDVFIDVTFMKDPSGFNNYDAVKEATVTKMKADAGTAVIIKFSGITDDTSFNLSMSDFEVGEGIDNPIVVNVDAAKAEATEVSIPQKAVNYWYKYVAPKTGKLTVSADITDGLGNNALYVRVGKNGQSENFKSYAMSGSTSTVVFRGSKMVNEGDEVYVNLVVNDAQKDKKLTFALADPEKGESSSNPIELTAGEHTVAKATRTAPLWYSVELPTEGKLTIRTIPGNSNMELGAYLYAADADGKPIESNPLAYSSTVYDETTYSSYMQLSYVVNGVTTNTGKFFVQVYSTSGETPIVVSIDKIAPGEDFTQAIELAPGDTTLMKASYSAPVWYKVNLAEGEFKMVSTDANNYSFNAELYAVGEDGAPSTSYVAYSQMVYDATPYYTQLLYNVDGTQAAAGEYYIKLNMAYSEIPVTLTFNQGKPSGIGHAEASADDVLIENGRIEAVNGEPLAVYDLSGRIVANGKGSVNVKRGIYVVRTQGGKSVKVSIK